MKELKSKVSEQKLKYPKNRLWNYLSKLYYKLFRFIFKTYPYVDWNDLYSLNDLYSYVNDLFFEFYCEYLKSTVQNFDLSKCEKVKFIFENKSLVRLYLCEIYQKHKQLKNDSELDIFRCINDWFKNRSPESYFCKEIKKFIERKLGDIPKVVDF